MWATVVAEVLDPDNPFVPAWRRALWERALAAVTPDADDPAAWDALVADPADPDDGDGDWDGDDPLAARRHLVRGLDVLSLLESMAAHWSSETHASLLAWPWRLFCAKWVRLMEDRWREERRERDRDDERARLDAARRADEDEQRQARAARVQDQFT